MPNGMGEWLRAAMGAWQWRWIKPIEAARACGALEDGAHRSLADAA
jgi:hypothetical protein